MGLLEGKLLNDKVIQVALRQILGTHVSLDLKFKELFDTILEGMSLGMLVACTSGNLNNLNEVGVLKKALPHIVELSKIVAFEMNVIIHDDTIDQVTVLATKVLSSLMESQRGMSEQGDNKV